MGLTHVSVALKVPGASNGSYEAVFLVDAGATDSMAPASELARAGIQPIGRKSYELADGRVTEYPFGLAQIEFMGEVTAGRIIFGPEAVEPILGVTVLESAGVSSRSNHAHTAALTCNPAQVGSTADRPIY